MGAYESIPLTDDEQQEQEQEHEHEEEDINHDNQETRKLLEQDDNNNNDNHVIMNKVMQEKDISSSSSSSFSTTPSIVTSQIPPRTFSLNNDDPTITELYIICHGECHMKLRPDLVGGRCPEAALTPNGKRQARALAVFLKSQGIRFNVVYTSPLDRARATAIPVCQEMNFPEQMIEASEALQEMSEGVWEGCQRSHVYTPSVLSLMDRLQPDFCAPSGETLRQVEFRMIQFLNSTIDPNDTPNTTVRPPRQLGLPKKKSSKSRLEMVRTGRGGGDQEADDEMSPRDYSKQRDQHHEISLKSNNMMKPHPSSCCCIGIFSHSVPIKCLITSVLGCSPIMSNKICIHDSSVTVLQHSRKLGWQIKTLNDTCHLRLM